MKQTLLVLILFASITSFAQKIEFAGEVNGATFRMSDAKRLQQEFADALPFPTKVVRNFSSSIGYGSRISLRLHRFDILLFGTFNSAESEIEQTGTISLTMFFQQHATVLNVGLGTDYRLSAKALQKIEPYVGVRIGMGQTKFRTRDRRVIDSMIILDETNYFKSRSVSSQTYLGLKAMVLKPVFVHSQLGFELHVSEKLMPHDDDGTALTLSNGGSVNIDWSGVRMIIGFGARF